jgi:GR25 family glycosyltransferase involved in LPS biosynthesis
MNIQYYLIHGVDKQREPRMLEEFKKWNLDNNKVKWILEPNKYNITEDFRKKLLIQEASYTCGTYTYPGCPNINNGQISCTYKHYLCLKDIIENNYEYGVIMEDNQYFCGDIPVHVDLYIQQLNTMYPDWDIIFDSKWLSYKNIEENEVKEGVFVYPKSNEIGKYVHGGTRLAQFYILTNNCAKKLYENYIPFNNAPDWWMNDLFRKLDIKSFWSEPCISDNFPHISTATN